MKNIFLWVTAFILSLTSCQQSEVVDNINAGNNQLNFGVYQGKATRAGELTNSDLNKDNVSFPLYAYRGKQELAKTLYFEEMLTYGTPVPKKWNTSIPRFLPEGATEFLQFYAFYAPSADNPQGGIKGVTYKEALDANKYPTLDYTIQDTQVDLVAASINDNTGKSITIPFKHILSQINFGVKGYYGARIKISNIVIHNAFKEGTFNFDPSVWGWTGQKTVVNDYPYLFAKGTTPANSTYTTPGQDATTPANESNYTYIFGDGGNGGPGLDTNLGAENIWYVNDATTVVQGSTITNGKTGLSNALMLMPQTFIDQHSPNVTFDYTIQDLGDNYVIGSAGAPAKGQFDLKFTTGTGTESTDYQSKWDPNLRYVYIIDFTGYLDGQALNFTVDVDSQPWENYDGSQGIVLLTSTGEPIFNTHIKPLLPTGDYNIPAGNVFSNISWDWSLNTMTNDFTTIQEFTIKFANVKFNGNKITVNPPFGFEVSSDKNTYGTTIDVSTAATVLTFRPETHAYYGTPTGLNKAIATDNSYTFNASNAIKLTEVVIENIKGSHTVTLNFVSAYYNLVPKNWELTNDGKTATYTVPAPVVP